ncbi:hypothetical protein C5Z26_00525 [Lactobacillus sp. CBA3606]|nr:hypothetical protein C5Z26_00525 [Lactobacillus sp. CBA3606]
MSGLKNSNMYGASKDYVSFQNKYLALMKRKRVNSYIMAVNKGAVRVQTANGVAKKGVNWSGKTQFRVASLQKLLTIDLVLQLNNSNKLALTDTIGKLIPELKNSKISDVSVNSLLTNNKNIYASKKIVINKDYYDLLAQFKLKKNLFEQGTDSLNINYLLLAMIIQRVSGERYIDFAQKQVLLKNGMNQTSFVSTDEINAQLAIPYHRDGSSVDYNNPYDNSDFVFGLDDLCMSTTNMYVLLDKSVDKYADSKLRATFDTAYKKIYGPTSIRNGVYVASNKNQGYESYLIVQHLNNTGLVYNITSKPDSYNAKKAAESYYSNLGD